MKPGNRPSGEHPEDDGANADPDACSGYDKGKEWPLLRFRTEGVFLLPAMFACEDALTKDSRPAGVRRDPAGRKRTSSGPAGLMAMRRASAPVQGSGRPRAAHA